MEPSAWCMNRQMAEPAIEVVRAEPPMPIRPDVHLFVGGPVEPTRAWVLLNDKNLDGEALEVTDGVYLSASPELIRRTLSEPPGSLGADCGRLCRLGGGAAGRRTGRVGVADGAGAGRSAVRRRRWRRCGRRPFAAWEPSRRRCRAAQGYIRQMRIMRSGRDVVARDHSGGVQRTRPPPWPPAAAARRPNPRRRPAANWPRCSDRSRGLRRPI